MRLENIFFPHQEVRAIPTHDINGEHHGSQISLDQDYSKIQGRDDAFGIEIIISLDEEKSVNPPYNFTISAFGIFSMNKKISDIEPELRTKIEVNARQMVIASIRERLSSITARGPWGGFMFGVISSPTPQEE